MSEDCFTTLVPPKAQWQQQQQKKLRKGSECYRPINHREAAISINFTSNEHLIFYTTDFALKRMPSHLLLPPFLSYCKAEIGMESTTKPYPPTGGRRNSAEVTASSLTISPTQRNLRCHGAADTGRYCGGIGCATAYGK